MPALSDRLFADTFPALGHAWRWWTDELAGLVPRRMHGRLSRQPRADVRPRRDGVEIVRLAGGQGERLTEAVPLTAFDDGNWQEIATLLDGHRTRLLLTAPLAHIVTLRLPKAARPYLRTAIPIQLADHAPLPLEHLVWATVDTKLVGESLFIRVAMARADVLATIETAFREHDIPLPDILAETSDGKAVPLRRAQDGTVNLSRPWAWAIGILALTPFLVLLVLHLLVLQGRDKVADLEELARPRLAAERRIREQADVAHGLNRILAIPAATSLIEDLADHIPPSAHALELSTRDDGTVDITLSTRDVDAARTALIGVPRLVSVRQLNVMQAPDGSSTVQYEAHVR